MIKIQNLNKTYVMGTVDVPVLKGINLEINEHEFVAIMGPSGSGKTTLMNIIGCLDTPNSGNYTISNVDTSNLDDEELSRLRGQFIGFVFQVFHLLPGKTSLENVMLPCLYMRQKRNDFKERAIQLLHDVGLKHRLSHYPNQLSGGEQQRVAIARALMNDPKIILADEPTGALDSEKGAEVMEIFKSLHKKEKTIILVTHDTNVSAFAQRVIRLKDGRVV